MSLEAIEELLKSWRIYVFQKESNGEFAERTKQHISELEAALRAEWQDVVSNQIQCASCGTTMIADGIPGQLYCPKCQPSAAPSLHKEGAGGALQEAKLTEDAGWVGGWVWTCSHGNQCAIKAIPKNLDCGCKLLSASPIARCQQRHQETGQCELRAGHEGSHLAGYIMWAGRAEQERK